MRKYYQVIVYVDSKTNNIYSAYAFEYPEDETSEAKTRTIISVGGLWEGYQFKTNAWETYCYAENEKEAIEQAKMKVEEAKKCLKK